MKLAFHVANREYTIDRDQALSVCMGALMRAAEKWTPACATPFGAFAGQFMRYDLGHERRRMRAQRRGGGRQNVCIDELPLTDERLIPVQVQVELAEARERLDSPKLDLVQARIRKWLLPKPT